MLREFAGSTTHIAFPLFALFLFVSMFTIVVVRAIRTPKSKIDELGHLPLEHNGEGR